MLVVALVFAAVGGVIGWAAFAAPSDKGGGGGGKPGSGSSSLSLVMVTDNNGDGQPNYGDTITFNINTTQTKLPYVDVRCYQGGTLVYSASAGFYDGYLWPGAQKMPLSSPVWTGGAADCSAYLNMTASKGGKVSALATLNFHVNP